MKKFVYQVAGFEFVDTTAFGTAWKDAKAMASENNYPVYRLVIKDEEARQEVYCTGGCFLPVNMVKKENIKINWKG